MSPRCFTVWFLTLIGSFALNGGALAEDAPVSGVFKGNGKEAKLAFVSARKGDKLSDNQADFYREGSLQGQAR
jgi:hypothetical protein